MASANNHTAANSSKELNRYTENAFAGTRANATVDPSDGGASFRVRSDLVMKAAQNEFAKTGSWVIFYRKIFGSDGIVMTQFSSAEDFKKFVASEAHAELQEMVAAMRSQDVSKGDANEPEKMITIRLPVSLHDTLIRESKEAELSINKLCISKLLQPIESRFVPVQQGKRRGRKPGPQGPRKSVSNSAQSPHANPDHSTTESPELG